MAKFNYTQIYRLGAAWAEQQAALAALRPFYVNGLLTDEARASSAYEAAAARAAAAEKASREAFAPFRVPGRPDTPALLRARALAGRISMRLQA